jgi:hypothetical protein
MKINWGNGLLIAILVSSLGIVFLVILSSKENIDLVTEEYYPRELVFDQQIDKLKNTRDLQQKVIIEETADSILIRFPCTVANADWVEGEIWFYYAANKQADKKITIELNDAYIQKFALTEFTRGKCEIIIDWTDGKLGYMQQEILFLNETKFTGK